MTKQADKIEKNIAVISLGCDKNRVDTERMLFALSGGDFRIAAEEDADIIIINTCAFILPARKEAIDTILAAAELKKGRLEKLIVTGCLPQKYMGEIQALLPEVDAFLGTNNYDGILSVIQSLYNGKRIAENAAADTVDPKGRVLTADSVDPKGRVLTTDSVDPKGRVLTADSVDPKGRVLTTDTVDPKGRVLTADSVDPKGRVLTTDTYAYLKIADGCDNHCTYCTIPSIRGAYRSRTIESLTAEAQSLAGRGVRELVLVAQDVTRYGTDLYKRPSLVPLLKELSKTDIQYIRLLYCYPELVDGELIAEIKNNGKIVKYLDIPLQHISDKVLRLMGRRGRAADIKGLIDTLRREIPQIAIRSTFMTGFPTEDESDHEELLDFLKEYKLNNVGFFVYSLEKDTPSAKLKGRVDKKTAFRRLKELAAAQKQVAEDYSRAFVGQTLDVLYEGIDYKKGLFFGRTFMSAPDVDPLVYFRAGFAEIGSVYRVKITGFKGYDLVGEVQQEH